jgi:thioredoxin reductase
VTLFLHTQTKPTDEEWDQLSARGIRVVDGEVAGLVVTDDRLTGVRLASGQTFTAQAIIVAPRFTARSGVLAGLGVEAVEHPRGVGTQVPTTDPSGRSEVSGLWVAGNTADVVANIAASVASGSAAAAAINADMIMADTATAVAESRPAGLVRA